MTSINFRFLCCHLSENTQYHNSQSPVFSFRGHYFTFPFLRKRGAFCRPWTHKSAELSYQLWPLFGCLPKRQNHVANVLVMELKFCCGFSRHVGRVQGWANHCWRNISATYWHFWMKCMLQISGQLDLFFTCYIGQNRRGSIIRFLPLQHMHPRNLW